MGILADHQIEAMNFITPFSPCQRRPGIISYGVSSMGYDVRCGYRFKVFTNAHCGIVDPKNFDPRSFVDVELAEDGTHQFDDDYRCVNCDKQLGSAFAVICSLAQKGQCNNFILIPPNSFALAETIEHITVPRDLICVLLGKSTYARIGIILNATPLEPEWSGKVTIEISNTTPLPAKIYAGEGIAQALFFRSESPCRVSYADKQGIYQSQDGLTLPKVAK